MLIKQAGADSCNVAPNVISDALNMKTTLEKFRDTPVIVRERMIALLEIPQVAGRPMPVKLGLSDADVALLDGFITAAAAAALTKSHHIDDMAEAMRRSRMYDWRVDHDEDCDTSNAAHPERRTKEWFGVLDFSCEEYGDNIDAEYKRWNAHLKTLDPLPPWAKATPQCVAQRRAFGPQMARGSSVSLRPATARSLGPCEARDEDSNLGRGPPRAFRAVPPLARLGPQRRSRWPAIAFY